ncbi:MAG: hypothetical protein KF773_11785 [Deltaproteobacteria bacterium]|nr:hypothetical protein [Deltaproteobacteria bacterium]
MQLDKVTRRRRRVRRLLVLALLAALIALAVTYLTCGPGFGFGGKGKGDGSGSGSGSGPGVQPLVTTVDAPPARCAVRIASAGITVDGAKATREEAVAACKGREGADLTVTGGARQGDFDELRAAFGEAKIPFTIIDASAAGGSGSGAGSGSAP